MTTPVQFGIATEMLQRRRNGQHRGSRRGALTVFVLIFLVISILLMMLVLNWIWLVLHNRDMQRRSDVLALTAAVDLLDDGLLEDRKPHQRDDVIDAKRTLAAFREFNNQVAADALVLERDNVTMTPGRVENVEDGVFVKAKPYNALRVDLHRYASGPNPARLMIRGFGSPGAADVKTASVAALDSRLIGFRPTRRVATPLAPLAISARAWRNGRRTDFNSNRRLELAAILKRLDGTGRANSALVDVDEMKPINRSIIPSQIVDGISPTHLTHPIFGPATRGAPLPVPATRISPPNTIALVAAFKKTAVSSDPRRIFPVYKDGFSNPLKIVGFVAARVLGATNRGGRLRVRLEPAFIVHLTAVTDPRAPENETIHKLRLVQ